jgi:hypothetical protein
MLLGTAILNVSRIARIEVLRVLVMKSSIVCNVTPYSPLKVSRCFWGTCYLLFVGHCLGLFFYPEGISDTFLRNVGQLSTDYPRTQNSLSRVPQVPVFFVELFVTFNPTADISGRLCVQSLWIPPTSKICSKLCADNSLPNATPREPESAKELDK